MLEGRPEQIALASGKFIADRLAILRINHGLRKDIFNFVKQNKTPITTLFGLFKSAVAESINRKHLSAWPTLLMCGLIYGSVISGWISATKYWTKFHRMWGGPTRSISDVKTLTLKLSQSHNISDIGYFVNNQFWDRNWNTSSLQMIIDFATEIEYVVKRDYSERGKHVLVMSKNEISNFDFRSFGNCVIQRKIKQLPLLTKLSGGTTVTIRVLSILDRHSNRATVASAHMKFDAPNSKSRRNFTIPLELDSYRTRSYGYSEKYKKYDLPKEFLSENKQFLWLKAAFDLAIETHSHFPHFQVIGWDIGIDEDAKPWIFEWNADHPALIRAQGFYGSIHVNAGLISETEVQ